MSELTGTFSERVAEFRAGYLALIEATGIVVQVGEFDPDMWLGDRRWPHDDGVMIASLRARPPS